MGDVVRFTGKRLSGFIPDNAEYPNLPFPFSRNLKETRTELAALITSEDGPEEQPSAYSAPPDDCA